MIVGYIDEHFALADGERSFIHLFLTRCTLS